MPFENVTVETHGRVGLIRLNRPRALNALSVGLIEDLNAALEAYEADSGIGAMVLTGSEKAFAAGADIREMQDKSFADAFLGDFISRWEYITRARKPIVAAVAGFALGGGCELAMMCYFILAADTAKFGQPEIKLGVIPGSGGTQPAPVQLTGTGITVKLSNIPAGGARLQVTVAGTSYCAAITTNPATIPWASLIHSAAISR